MKFSIKDFFSKCDQICRTLRIWTHLLKKPLMENFIFSAVWDSGLSFKCWLLSIFSSSGVFLANCFHKKQCILFCNLLLYYLISLKMYINFSYSVNDRIQVSSDLKKEDYNLYISIYSLLPVELSSETV